MSVVILLPPGGFAYLTHLWRKASYSISSQGRGQQTSPTFVYQESTLQPPPKTHPRGGGVRAGRASTLFLLSPYTAHDSGPDGQPAALLSPAWGHVG